MKSSIQNGINQRVSSNKKQLAVLLDPDKIDELALPSFVAQMQQHQVGLIFFGGSLLTSFELDRQIGLLKSLTTIPIILFPGSVQQVSAAADGILFLSLVSSRNPELLIGQQILAAPMVKRAGLEVLPTAYMLIDGGNTTTAIYMSGSQPLPANKPAIAACTALAAEMLGMKYLYLDAGSGALNHPPVETITAIKKETTLPLIVGGGIKTPEEAHNVALAGADIIVVGNAFEQNPELLGTIAAAINNF
ncbi:MAG: geranylgeranylglyceryl/heptaprenylglyceryl phosphate synthase [Schleiferiaceae bacterium]|nr:geranylgeranylglyceryl/heptaprenylglyceryl phosphate synthase [Schleiferiaceae bacterium]